MKVQRLLSGVIGTVWVCLGAMIIAIAVYIAITRAAFNALPNVKDDMQIWLSERSGLVVKADQLLGAWSLLHPSITFKGLSVYDSNALTKIAVLEKATIQLDLPKSFQQVAPVISVSLVSGELHLSNDQGRLGFPGYVLSQEDITDPSPDQIDSDIHVLERFSQIPFDVVIDNVKVVMNNGENVAHQFMLNSHLQNKSKQLRGKGALESENYGDLAFSFDISVGRGVLTDWNGKAWVGSREFPYHAWVPEYRGWGVEKGQLDGQLWLELDAGRVERVQGSVGLNGTEIFHATDKPSGEVFKLDALSLKLRYVHETARDDRKLDIYDLDIDSDAGIWVDRRLRFSQYSDDTFRYQETQLDLLDLSMFSDLVLRSHVLPEKFHTKLDKLNLDGHVSNVVVRFKKPAEAGSSDAWTPDFVHLKAQDLGWAAFNGIPAVSKLSGWVHSDENGAVAQFDIVKGSLNVDTVYDHPLNDLDFSGLVRMRHLPSGWLVESNRLRAKIPEADFAFEMALSKIGDDPIALSLHGNLVVGDIKNVGRLLPTKVLTERLGSWLNYALRDGTLSLGDLMWEGTLQKTSTLEHTLGFKFEIDSLLLHYFEGWPPLEQGRGVVDVVNGDTYIALEHASVNGVTLLPSEAKVMASQEKKPSVEFLGKAKGTTRQLLSYLASSPLATIIPRAILDLDLSADALVELDLVIPLAEGARQHYEVGIDVSDGQLTYAPIKLNLSSMKGRIQYSFDDGVSIPNLDAQFLGSPISMHASSTRKDNRVVATTLEVKGQPPLHSLFDWQGWERLPGVSGAAPIMTRIQFPWSQNPIEVFVESELEGVAVTLPQPFSKLPEQQKSFRSHVRVSPEHSSAELTYGQDMRGLFRWSSVHRPVGHIVWGKTPPKVVLGKDESGLVLELNQMDLDLQPWFDFFKLNPNNSDIDPALVQGHGEKSDPFSLVIRLSDGGLTLGKHHLENVSATFKRLKSMNLVLIDSDDMKGTIEWPAESTGGRLNVDLSLLRYPLSNAIVEKAGAELPRFDLEEPPSTPSNLDWLGERAGVRLVIDKLVMHGEDWGSWNIVASNHPTELIFESVSAQSTELTLDARGEWLKLQDGISRIEGSATIGNIATLFRGFGQDALLMSKRGNSRFSFSWPGAPQDFNATHLNGRADIKLEEGRVNVSGRGTALASVFGLLNLRGLFKLLQLDFSDVTKEGLGFDSLDGEYLINQQLLTIGGVKLKGNTLGMDLSGSIDFMSRKLNQQMDITIPLSDGLIIPAALTGSLPILATVFVVDRAFGSTINDLTKTRFTIMGTIENPEFKLKGAPLP